MTGWNKRVALFSASIVAAAIAGAAAPASASTAVPDYHFTWTINSLQYKVDNISFWVRVKHLSGLVEWKAEWLSPSPGNVAPAGGTAFSESIKTSGTIIGSLLLGVTSGLGNGPKDLVLFTNSTWAQGAAGAEWSSLFWSDEKAIIADVNSAYAADKGADIEPVTDFIKTEPGIASALIAPNGSFAAIAFSTGQIIGSGSSTITVPEPATWATMVVGFAALAWSARRRRAHALA